MSQSGSTVANTPCMVIAIIMALIFCSLMVTFFAVGGVLANPNYQKVMAITQDKQQELPYGYVTIASGFSSCCLATILMIFAFVGCKETVCKNLMSSISMPK